MSPLQVLLLFTYLLCIQSAPTEPPKDTENEVKKNDTSYDVSQFDEVYDQRQNGSENYRLNVNKVVLVWTPPESLLTAALLLDPGLYDSEDFLLTEEKPGGGTTTKVPEASTVSTASSGESTTVGSTKRKLKVPGFLRPYMRRQHQIRP